MIQVNPVPAFKDNYIWLIGHTDSRQVAIVDPGDARPMLDALQGQSLTPCAILLTHHHRDHVGGVTELLRHFDIPVYGPAHEPVPALTHPLREGDRVALPDIGLTLSVLDVPGHTRGAIAYYGHGCLFCGDTLFTAGCGYLFEGTPPQMYHSLSKLAALAPETQVYCGHEYTLDNLSFARVVEPRNADISARITEATRLRARNLPTVPALLALELRTNPFLRCHTPVVIAAAESHARRPLSTPAEVFGVVRRWKDDLDSV
ncbi:MAG: hydroxyacylglutathione hydrolase [Proteobacteria bacterium]|nr:hydroxyacylglutathione hydrolase [Pseudomonadota bacterium]